jgi:hypothetical protein
LAPECGIVAPDQSSQCTCRLRQINAAHALPGCVVAYDSKGRIAFVKKAETREANVRGFETHASG